MALKSLRFNSPIQRRRSKRKRLLLAVGILALVIAAVAALDATNVIDIPGFKDTPSNKINYDPPTEEEKKETEEFKKSQVSSENKPVSGTTTPGQKQSVTLFVTSWGYSKISGNAEISGYVSGVIENGGTCTLTMKKGSSTVTETKTGAADAQNTSCGLISISRSRLSPGSWTSVLSYDSSIAEGSSRSLTMEVE